MTSLKLRELRAKTIRKEHISKENAHAQSSINNGKNRTTPIDLIRLRIIGR